MIWVVTSFFVRTSVVAFVRRVARFRRVLFCVLLMMMMFLVVVLIFFNGVCIFFCLLFVFCVILDLCFVLRRVDEETMNGVVCGVYVC